MNVNYIYCPKCGYEADNIFVAYSRQTANNNWYICPGCGEETAEVEIENQPGD